MQKKKVIDWDEDNFDLMTEEKQNQILKEFEKTILKAKETPEGRRRLAKAFGGRPSKYLPNAVNKQ